MTTVINVPPSLDDATIEQVLDQVAPLARDQKILIDARHTRWASPYALTTLLTVAQTRAERAGFAGPENDDTASYWARTGFYKHAEQLCDLHGHVPRARNGGESSVLLEITPVAKSEDVHDVVERIQQKAQAILVNELHLDPQATMFWHASESVIAKRIVACGSRCSSFTRIACAFCWMRSTTSCTSSLFATGVISSSTLDSLPLRPRGTCPCRSYSCSACL